MMRHVWLGNKTDKPTEQRMRIQNWRKGKGSYSKQSDEFQKQSRKKREACIKSIEKIEKENIL